MRDQILSLDDPTALRVLSTVARARMRSGGYETETTPAVGDALREAFHLEAAPSASSTPGDLARQALLVLADDPGQRDALRALIEGPAARSFDAINTGAIIVAALFVLQTHLKFEWRNGKLNVLMEKKPTTEALLKPLVQKVVNFLGPGPSA